MHCLRLFIVVLQELHCLPNCLHVFMIRAICCYHITYRNVLLFYKNYIVYRIVYMFFMIRVICCYHITKFCYSVSEIAKCIA